MAPEFKNLTEEEKKEVKARIDFEKDFMAAHDFYSHPANRQFRKFAVSAIATHCQGNDFDAFVPYLAMNHFDRFISKSKKPYSDAEEVHKVAMTCLLVAAQHRADHEYFFSEPTPSDFDTLEIKRQLYEVLQFELTVTPFYFLDYFYPPFEEIGGLTRRCINEIIVQAQGEDYFNTHNYTPSEIAYSSLLAAADIAYPSIQIELEGVRVPDKAWLAFCAQRLVDLCTEKNIMIERASSSSATVTMPYHLGAEDGTQTESGEQRDSKGKGIAPVVEEMDDDDEDFVGLYHSEAPKRLMKFYLQWSTKVAD